MNIPAFNKLLDAYFNSPGYDPEISNEAKKEVEELKRTLILAKLMRDAQKLFYKLRSKVGKTEHDQLLHKALQAESDFDKAIDDLISPKQVTQDKLL